MRPRLLLTMGDPAGVGPEVVLRAAADGDLRERFDLRAVGSRDALAFWSRRLEIPIEV